MHHVVCNRSTTSTDLVGLQREHLAQSASNLVAQDHGLEDNVAIDALVLLSSSHSNRVVIIMAKLTSLMRLQCRVVPKHCSIGIPEDILNWSTILERLMNSRKLPRLLAPIQASQTLWQGPPYS
jgi:hypothetical protein